MAFEYRVTKYNPAYRDDRGAYTRDEWIAFDDIGSEFGGTVLTASEYQRVEDAYVTAALEFLREAGVVALKVADLENHAGALLSIAEGDFLELPGVGNAIRRLLRAEFWCRLESPVAFIHVGYDYYLYVGVPAPCPSAMTLAYELGLFVESFRSPYGELYR